MHQLIRRYHRVIRVLLFVAITWALFAGWSRFIDPDLLGLATLGEFAVVFLLLGTAAVATHHLGHRIAPPEIGQIDEDTDEVETKP